MRLTPKPLSTPDFTPFGDVIGKQGEFETINEGMAKKYFDLAQLELQAQRGRPSVHIYQATPCHLPLGVTAMERHPLSSQLFMPLDKRPFLILVAPPGESPRLSSLAAFISDGSQGVNYYPGTWHHPLLALEQTSDFLVLDRTGPGINCDEWVLGDRVEILPQS